MAKIDFFNYRLIFTLLDQYFNNGHVQQEGPINKAGVVLADEHVQIKII